MAQPCYKRVLLKLSGEVFCGEDARGIVPERLTSIAEEIAAVARLCVELAVVVGGGNFVRGGELQRQGIGRAAADHMGMLATVVNALAFQDRLEALGLVTRVQTALRMTDVAEPYIRRRAMRHLEKGRVVILAGGTGNPLFTTDTTAALRAAEIGAEIVLKGTKVRGIYDQDPKEHPDARFYRRVAFQEVLEKNLRVMDGAAIVLCRDNALPICVFNVMEPGNIERAVRGEEIGSLVVPDD